MIASESSLAACRAALRHALLNEGVKLGQGVDDSGRAYQWMVDCREVLLRQIPLHQAARLLWERIKTYRPEAVGGMTLAANPLIIAVLYEAMADGVPLDGFIIRKEPKANGLQKWVEGPELKPGTRVVLLDDLVNSGETQRKALSILKPLRLEVVAVGALIDCERAGATWLEGEGLPLEALFTLRELGVSLDRVPPAQTHRVVWKWGPLNHGRYPAPKSSPVITEQGIFVGSDAGFLAALTREGRERWRLVVRDRERGIHATPLYHEGRLYVGAYDGFVYCVDAESGRVIWETRPGQWIGSSACLDPQAGRLFLGVEYGEAGGSLMALEAETGAPLWELKLGHYVHSSPVHDSQRGQVIVGANDYAVYAADAADGRLRWKRSTGGEVKGDPVLDAEGRCFVGAFDGYLYALDAAGGELLWKRQLGHRLQVRPLILGDLVISGGSCSRLVALERDTGAVRWMATTGGAIVGGAAVLGDCVAVGSADGRLYLFDHETGQLRDAITTSGPIMTTPAVEEGLCVFPSFDGGLWAIARR